MTTYANLKTFIAGFAHRTDLNEDPGGTGITALDFFMQLAHADIEERLDWQFMETGAVLDTSGATNVVGQIYEIDLGVDIFQVRSLTVNGVDVQFYEPGKMQQEFGTGQSNGVAVAWSIVGNKLWLAPGLGEVVMVARRRTPAMSQPEDENDIAKNYPNLYVYGALVHLHRYVQDSEEEMRAQAQFDRDLDQANARAVNMRSGSTPAMVPV